jgi:hypothetical protein
LAKDKQQQQAAESTLALAFELTPKSPYAYMFVIGGIHEDRPNYKGFSVAEPTPAVGNIIIYSLIRPLDEVTVEQAPLFFWQTEKHSARNLFLGQPEKHFRGISNQTYTHSKEICALAMSPWPYDSGWVVI